MIAPRVALKRALVERLKADAAVAALVSGRVYDEAPADSRGDPADISAGEPYVYLGPLAYQRFEFGCAPAWTVRQRIYCVSFGFGREAAWAIHDAVWSALDLAEFDLAEGHAFNHLKIVDGGDVISPLAPKEAFLDLVCTLYAAEDWRGAI